MNLRCYGITALLFSIPLMFASSMTSASISFEEDSANDPYHVGKVTYHRKLACSGCPMSATIIDASMYKSVIQRLNNDEQLMTLLNDDERIAVVHYLEKLFTPR